MDRVCNISANARPVIAMVHLPALPGTPPHDAEAGLAGDLRIRFGVKVLRDGEAAPMADLAGVRAAEFMDRARAARTAR